MANPRPVLPVPAVSIIIPAYGVAHLVGEALRSVQAQTREDWEAIVVDDGAPDDVAGAVAPFLAADPRIRLLQTDNGGLATARNRGIAAARADRIALLDGDDRFRPGYVEKMMAALDADPRLGFVTCDAVFFGMADREGRRFSDYEPQVPPITLEKVIERQFNVFGLSTVRREAIDSVGGYEGSLRSSEDLDFWVRLLAAGWPAGYVAEPLCEYYRRPGSLSANAVGLARSNVAAYERFVALLAGRPERAAAERRLTIQRRKLALEEGEELCLSGRSAEGVRMLHAADAHLQSPRWAMAMRAMRLFPPIAGPLIRLSRNSNPLAGGGGDQGVKG